MRKLLFLLFFLPALAHAYVSQRYPTTPDAVDRDFNDTFDFVHSKTDILTSGTSGYIFTAQGSSTTAIWQASGTLLPTGTSGYLYTAQGAGVTSSFQSNPLTTNTSGQIFVGQGNNTPVKNQWDGRINGPFSYSVTTASTTTGTGVLSANTGLTGTFATLTASEKVTIQISATCGSNGTGDIGLKRDSTNISGATNGIIRTTSPESGCSFSVPDTPGSVGTFTYTVTFYAESGTTQFGETNRASWMIITGYPK